MSERARDIQIWSDVYRLLPAWTWETTADYRLSYVQSSVSDWTGIDLDRLLGFMILLDEYEEKDGTNSDSYIATLRRKEPINCIAYERVLLSGEKVVLVDNAVPRFDEAGGFLGYRGVSINLTEILKQADDTDSLVLALQNRAEQLEETLSERNRELQDSNDLLYGILENMGEGLMVTSGTDVNDPQNRILLVNQAYRELFDLRPDDIPTGMPLVEVMAMLRHRDRMPKNGSDTCELNARLASGEKIMLDIPELDRFYYAKAAPGPTGGYVLVHTDITELEQKNEALRLARDAAEVASLAKSNFLATMSHEIRTPMNGIVGMAELLDECGLEGEAAEYVDTIKSAALALTHLISEILDFSKIEAGQLIIKQEPFDLRALIADMKDLLGPMAAAKGLQLLCNVDPSVPDSLQGDQMRLRQVLLNLLGNAVKFTVTGEVTVDVRMQDGVCLRVADTGIGIPEEALPQIFLPFQQVESGRERQFEGTGLGLSITKQLVDAMGGRVAVESTLNEGTAFDIWLPLEQGRACVIAQTATHPDDITLNGMRILVVEDNKTNQTVVRKMLENRGAVVTLAQNGQEAVESFAPERFDLILMDISMPVMSGLEAARHIRSDEHRRGWPRVPIIALTGNAFDRDRNEALSAGMDGFLSKPVRRDALLMAIATHLPAETGAEMQATGTD